MSLLKRIQEMLNFSDAPQQSQAQPQQPIQFPKPQYEDGQMEQSVQGYAPQSNDVAHMQGYMQNGRNPVDMETVPGNFGRYRTGYYQGSNPNLQQTDQEALRDIYIRNLRVR